MSSPSSPGRAEPESASRMHPAGRFASVMVIQAIDETGDDFVVPIAGLVDWLSEYDRLYKRALGLNEGRALHRLFGRSTVLACDDLLSAPTDALVSRVSTLISTCAQSGMGPSLTEIDIGSCVRHSEVVDAWADVGLGTIGLSSGDGGADHAACRELVTALIERGVTVHLVGAMDFWRESGVLAVPALNSQSFQIAPAKPGRPGSTEYRRGDDPCRARFQAVVYSDGYVYPCRGLAGIRSQAIARVGEALDASPLGGGGGGPELERLADRGPRADELSSEDMEDSGFARTLPLVCRLHRRWAQEQPSPSEGA